MNPPEFIRLPSSNNPNGAIFVNLAYIISVEDVGGDSPKSAVRIYGRDGSIPVDVSATELTAEITKKVF